MNEVMIHRATNCHVNAVLACLRQAFASFESCYTAVALEDTVLTRESFLRRLEEMAVFVAVDRDWRVIGTIACGVLADGEGHLRGMAVLPDWQASGVADRLLRRAEVELISRNCRRITLDTTEPLQRAMRFYERHSYRRSGRVQDFFGMPLIEYFKDIG